MYTYILGLRVIVFTYHWNVEYHTLCIIQALSYSSSAHINTFRLYISNKCPVVPLRLKPSNCIFLPLPLLTRYLYLTEERQGMRGWGINRLFLGKELGILKSDLWITLEGRLWHERDLSLSSHGDGSLALPRAYQSSIITLSPHLPFRLDNSSAYPCCWPPMDDLYMMCLCVLCMHFPLPSPHGYTGTLSRWTRSTWRQPYPAIE